MNTENLRKWAYIVIIALGGIALGYLAVRYLLAVLLPFLIAWAIAFIMRPPSAYLSARLHVKPSVVRPILTCITALFVMTLLGIGVWRVSVEVWQIITKFGEGDEFRSLISGIFDEGGLFESLFGTFGDTLTDAIYDIAVSLLGGLWGAASSLIESIPRVFLFIVITVISTVYFAIDLERVNAAVMSLLPKHAGEWLRSFKNGFLFAGLRYVRSYALLFLTTFVTVIAGFLLLRVPYAFLLALIISFLDLLPVIGTGTFLIPFGIIELIMGNSFRGIGLFVLFVIQTVTRQFLEPKILGKNLGVHPILTLVILFVGYSFFGLFGILLVPLFTVIAEILIGKKNTPDVEKPTRAE
ncbi:MAG: AI-2E family transporter [Clostridia bacterium]|nr:AI-2E family transporter [Clostridia bacterium]